MSTIPAEAILPAKEQVGLRGHAVEGLEKETGMFKNLSLDGREWVGRQ